MPDADLIHLVLRRDAVVRGIADDEIARLRRLRTWTPLQRGAYLLGEPALGTRTRHLLQVRATVAGLRTPATISHASAAAIHGLPLWQVPVQRVHITREPPARSAQGTRLRSHVARLPAEEVAVVAGHPVTTVARTVVDLARTLPFAPALAIADASLRPGGGATHAQLWAVLETSAGTRGSRAAARVVRAADGRCESVGESRSRALMIELGLPLPDLQYEVTTPDGQFVGRTDFGWRERRLLGEFDGRVKYGRLLRAGQTAGDAVFEEKRREDALRAQDYGMVRWTWQDLDRPVAWAAGIRRRLDPAV